MFATKYKYILQSTAWVTLCTGLFRLVTLLIAIMSAQLLSVEDYGKVSVLQSTSALFIMIATMGLGTVATKLVAERDGYFIKALAATNWGFCLIAALGVYLCSQFIAVDIYRDESLDGLIQWLAFYILFCGVTQIQSGILAGKEAYRLIASVNLWLGLLSIGGVYAGISLYGVQGWIVSLIAIEMLKACVLYVVIQRHFTMPQWQLSSLKEVLKPALPIAVSGFFILPVNWFLIRELLLANGYIQVAVMNIVDQWIAILTFIPIALGNAMLPIMAKMGQSSERNNTSNVALKMNVLIAFVSSVPVAVAAHYILLAYGQEYTEFAFLFWVLIPLVVVLAMTNQLNNRVIADNKANAMLTSNIIWMCIGFPISLGLIAFGFGILGLLIGRLFGYIAKLLYLLYVSSN